MTHSSSSTAEPGVHETSAASKKVTRQVILSLGCARFDSCRSTCPGSPEDDAKVQLTKPPCALRPQQRLDRATLIHRAVAFRHPVALEGQIEDLARVHRNGATVRDEHHCTVWPPSITMAWPIMKAASSEQSQMTAAAISSGLPIRPTGSSAITFARPSAVPPVKRPIIGVSM